MIGAWKWVLTSFVFWPGCGSLRRPLLLGDFLMTRLMHSDAIVEVCICLSRLVSTSRSARRRERRVCLRLTDPDRFLGGGHLSRLKKSRIQMVVNAAIERPGFCGMDGREKDLQFSSEEAFGHVLRCNPYIMPLQTQRGLVSWWPGGLYFLPSATKADLILSAGSILHDVSDSHKSAAKYSLHGGRRMVSKSAIFQLDNMDNKTSIPQMFRVDSASSIWNPSLRHEF
ncbi:hypothetical protein BDV10DRAFT_100572 [Aspergillus recurvatus]